MYTLLDYDITVPLHSWLKNNTFFFKKNTFWPSREATAPRPKKDVRKDSQDYDLLHDLSSEAAEIRRTKFVYSTRTRRPDSDSDSECDDVVVPPLPLDGLTGMTSNAPSRAPSAVCLD